MFAITINYFFGEFSAIGVNLHPLNILCRQKCHHLRTKTQTLCPGSEMPTSVAGTGPQTAFIFLAPFYGYVF